MQKRNHSREFKLEVVRQVTTGQKRPAQACREYGLADSVLSYCQGSQMTRQIYRSFTLAMHLVAYGSSEEVR